MIPVLVETNWIVDVSAPAYRRAPAAMALLARAAAGELEIHVPSIALREAADVVRRKFRPSQSKVLQEYRRWADQNDHIDDVASVLANGFLSQFVSHTNSALENLNARLDELASAPGVRVYALSEPMLERAIALRTEINSLGPFDEAILAATLVRAESLRERSPVFCTLDRHVAGLNRRDEARPEFVELYAAAGLTVRTDFLIPQS